ncbi:hypothetical protein [Streptococcus merionis]|uniref:hypothetical protein n=1 Tax=Streptococcus merionis TaxID=400065 RepID=UPI0026EB0D6F|nr:hypothetical protein [Streptococcus merionis]
MNIQDENLNLGDPAKESLVFNPIKALQRVLPITDGGILVDEFGEYKELAVMLGLKKTTFKGKLAYQIV